MTTFITNYLKIALVMGCFFKLFVLLFSPSFSSVETLIILVTVLFLVHERYIVRIFTISLWSFVITLFLLSILVKFSLYIEYNNFDYLMETPISASECFINFILNEVGMVKDLKIVSEGNVNVIDNSVNVPRESNTSVVDKWKSGDYRPAAILMGEGSIKAMASGVTANAAFTLMGKSKVVIKVAAVSAVSMTAVTTVIEAFISK
jgi:hypothetical protein